ncbi:potassium transporter TrkG [Cytophagales bacterium LB-30]|uniref:Potassium transporter TrkG n=1 Tax=Shiella aurantiaca TaxID=3058365 RepID=A0ABT8F7C5_9BACT|nr:potassium transporter TrkG [Shiella aurantiaca]MDN4166381.1 potassium transporter TrkG [Shiella aurantiaca]
MNLKKAKNAFVEWLNNLLYNSKVRVLNSVRAIRILASFAALGLIGYALGFTLSPQSLQQVFYGLDVVLYTFAATFLVSLLYSFRRTEYLRNHIFEVVLLGLLLINLISFVWFNNALLLYLCESLGYTQYEEFYLGLLSIFMLVYLVYELARANASIFSFKVKPAAIFVISFLLLIALGTALLMLPTMTVQAGSMRFTDALFTAVSACCVTGLIVVDTATYFTTKGQIVILILIQLGGLGIVSFASFFASFLKQGVGLKQQLMLQDFLSTESLFSVKSLLKQIIFITLLIEFLTFIGIFLTWSNEVVFTSIGQKLYFSLFHAISAFCNAGFSLYTNGLYEPIVRGAYIMHLVVVGSVILGGIGFSVIQDIFSPSALRTRMNSPWKNWRLSTQVAVYTSAGLLAFGTIVFYLLEYNNTLASLNFVEATITSFFQSGIARTAGFNTVDISALRTPTLIMLMFLMFIGASSGSIGGGIKTSTLYLIVASVVATIRGQQKIEIGKRFIPKELLFKALSIFFFAASLNILCIFFLTITDPTIDVMKLAFEQVSAFGTVGLSTGITASLSEAGKYVIILSMFLGRVGTLTFVLALGTRVATQSYQYPKAHMMVG